MTEAVTVSNMIAIASLVSEIRLSTERQTDRHTHRLGSSTSKHESDKLSSMNYSRERTASCSDAAAARESLYALHPVSQKCSQTFQILLRNAIAVDRLYLHTTTRHCSSTDPLFVDFVDTILPKLEDIPFVHNGLCLSFQQWRYKPVKAQGYCVSIIFCTNERGSN